MNGQEFHFAQSVHQLERELNLTRRSSRATDEAKPASLHRVGRQPKIHKVEYVEELRAKFEIAPFRASPVSKRRILNDRNVELAIGRSSKRVASQRAEST
jgi:hypothetical protein